MKSPRSFLNTRVTHALAGILAAGLLAHPAAAAQTKSYAITWFAPAMNSQEGDCPDGINPRWAEQRLINLATLGYSQKQITQMLKEENEGMEGQNYESSKITDLNMYRGRLDGKPVNAYLYPSTVIDPKLHAVRGARYAYGFNLDGKGGEAANAFEDPLTHEAGVDNEFARAVGCMPQFRGTLAQRPNNWIWLWGVFRLQRPAWLITIAGEDLARDGDVTIDIERAIESVSLNTDGTPRQDVTYRINPSPRTHNVYSAKIKDGVVTLREPGAPGIFMIHDVASTPEFRMSRLHMRLQMKPDGGLDGFIGGYQPWSDIYYGVGVGGKDNEDSSTGDLPGIYYLLKQHADADPDSRTGQNATISITYNLQAVPAFAVNPRSGNGNAVVAN